MGAFIDHIIRIPWTHLQLIQTRGHSSTKGCRPVCLTLQMAGQVVVFDCGKLLHATTHWPHHA